MVSRRRAQHGFLGATIRQLFELLPKKLPSPFPSSIYLAERGLLYTIGQHVSTTRPFPMSVTGSIKTRLSQTSRAMDDPYYEANGPISGAEFSLPRKSAPFTSQVIAGGEWNATSKRYLPF